MIPKETEQLLEKITQCKDKISVAEVCKLFIGQWGLLEKHSVSFQDVKNKVTDIEWTIFSNALIAGLFGSLYTNCDISGEEQLKRVEEFKKAFKDQVKKIILTEEKKPDEGKLN